jgi:hypothetical protein
MLKIDEDRMTRGKEVEKSIRGESKGGIPWIAFMDAEGKVLATSDAPPPDGNIGCPATEKEIDWFMGMLRKVRNRITPEQIDRFEAALRKYGESIRPPPRPATRPASRPASRPVSQGS